MLSGLEDLEQSGHPEEGQSTCAIEGCDGLSR